MLLICLQVQNEMALWFCTTYYSLGSPCCFRSDNNASPCTTHFCDKNLSCIFILHLTSFADWTQTRYEWVTILVCKKLYRWRKTYSYSIYLAYVLVFQRKPCLCLMNGLNSLKDVQHFDEYNSNQKEKKEK